VAALRASRVIPDEWVEIEHPGIDGTTRVPPRALKHWEERGWKAVPEKAKKSQKVEG
jgi:hypothetical protein